MTFQPQTVFYKAIFRNLKIRHKNVLAQIIELLFNSCSYLISKFEEKVMTSIGRKRIDEGL